MKRLRESCADDRITNLPADVIHRILVFLPIKDAAKTSVLSMQWRHRWRVTKFVLAIHGFVPCNDEIDLLPLYLSNKGVQHFTLNFDSADECLYDEDCVDLYNYQMHSSLFSALHLKSLQLQALVFTPPPRFVGFSKLTYLEFGYVRLPLDFFDSFLPKCPILESLRLRCCWGHAVEVRIKAPFLKSFHFWGFELVAISFADTPLLSDLLLHFVRCRVPGIASLFASLPALGRFFANGAVLKDLAAGDRMNVPTRLPTPHHQLQDLYLKSHAFEGPGMERVLVCLIMSSPNLRRLRIEVSPIDDQPSNDEVSSSLWRLLEAAGGSPGSSACLQHLRKFRIKHSLCTQVELDLVRFVLATAPLLRLVHVNPGFALTAKKIMKFMNEVMQFTRVSKEAKVIFDNDTRDDPFTYAESQL
ncbi:unnamed protein product [Linum trigynum]|uniref:F-box domain-containing protein n=1 Tax=Linum trigynum TaxID=586398 RepID=A0AAV2F2M1_9ROSI